MQVPLSFFLSLFHLLVSFYHLSPLFLFFASLSFFRLFFNLYFFSSFRLASYYLSSLLLFGSLSFFLLFFILTSLRVLQLLTTTPHYFSSLPFSFLPFHAGQPWLVIHRCFLHYLPPSPTLHGTHDSLPQFLIKATCDAACSVPGQSTAGLGASRRNELLNIDQVNVLVARQHGEDKARAGCEGRYGKGTEAPRRFVYSFSLFLGLPRCLSSSWAVFSLSIGSSRRDEDRLWR